MCVPSIARQKRSSLRRRHRRRAARIVGVVGDPQWRARARERVSMRQLGPVYATMLALLPRRARAPVAGPAGGPIAEWPVYGGDCRRLAPLAAHPDHARERRATSRSPGSTTAATSSDGGGETHPPSSFQVTPILVEGTLYFCTPFDRVFALDPETGAERWSYDPRVDARGHLPRELPRRLGVARPAARTTARPARCASSPARSTRA